MNIFVHKPSFVIIALLVFLFPCTNIAQQIDANFTMNQKHKTARNAVINEHFEDAVAEYSDLLKKEENVEVRSEYAYALALAQCYDGAIMNLDKILVSGKADKTTLFYISQVLKLMEYDELSDVFWTKEVSGVPSWIALKYESFVVKYKHMATINTDDLGKALQRANYLIAQEQYVQTIVLYQELVESYPNEYLPYIGFSALWESLGYKDLAVKYLQDGISVIGNDKQEYDADGVYKQHLVKLKSNNTYLKKAFVYYNLKDIGKNKRVASNENNKSFIKRKFMYFGFTSINKSLSLDAKFGIYTSDRTSFSVGLGYQSFDGVPSYLGSMSLYLGSGKVFSGLGLSLLAQKTGDDFDCGIGASVGGSFLKSIERHSIDCRLGAYYLIKATSFQMTLSIGYTYYF